jgi:hypothetical protein
MPVTMGIAADAIVVRHKNGMALLNATGGAHLRSRHVLDVGSDLLMRYAVDGSLAHRLSLHVSVQPFLITGCILD